MTLSLKEQIDFARDIQKSSRLVREPVFTELAFMKGRQINAGEAHRGEFFFIGRSLMKTIMTEVRFQMCCEPLPPSETGPVFALFGQEGYTDSALETPIFPDNEVLFISEKHRGMRYMARLIIGEPQ